MLSGALARLAITLGVTMVIGWMLVRAFEGLSAESRSFLLGLALGALGAGVPLVAALLLLRRSYHAEIASLRAQLDAAREESLRAQQAMWHQVVGREVIARITAPNPAPPPSTYTPPSSFPYQGGASPRPASDLSDWPDE